jgi:putative membrane protein
MKFIINLIVCIAAIFLLQALLPGRVSYSGVTDVVLAGALLWLVNMLVRPVLRLITLPLTILTFGLSSLILNTLLVLLVDYLIPGIGFGGFWPSFLLALIVSVLQVTLRRLFREK